MRARVAIIGAGMGGLASAATLANRGVDVVLFERAAAPGGKMREVVVEGRPMDAGPTVFTLRAVLEELYAAAGESLESHVKLIRANLLARHAWNSHEKLDLYSDTARSAAAIGTLAGAGEAAGFLRFAADAARIYRTLEHSFIRASRPSPLALARRVGLGALGDLANIRPFMSLWRACGTYFRDPRLRQLFGRYATYCGSSPFASPATLMLVAHVEQAGVWYVEGGMHRVAVALAALARRKGAALRFETPVARILIERGRVAAVQTEAGERLAVEAVILNGDSSALAGGLFGEEAARALPALPRAARSLSALTWNLHARTEGFELAHHSVFFGPDYAREFEDIFRRRRLPSNPTIYVCAQDRRDALARAAQPERLLCLVNAPAVGDDPSFDQREFDACETRLFNLLARFGLGVRVAPGACVRTSPMDFHRLFPGTGGALYGPASHGWRASFKRPGSRSRVPGLYLAGGSAHPGPGVPMALTSGRLAAAAVLEDFASIARSHRVGMHGGTSTA